jgi:hypothetical protein
MLTDPQNCEIHCEGLPAKASPRCSTRFQSPPAWKPGILEIHQIATNLGNSFVFDLARRHHHDARCRCYLWHHAISQRSASFRRVSIRVGRSAAMQSDVSTPVDLQPLTPFLLTHLHGDHVGYPPPDGRSSDGTYRRTGVSDVADNVPLQKFVDRELPDSDYPVPTDINFQKNYRDSFKRKSRLAMESSVFAGLQRPVRGAAQIG